MLSSAAWAIGKDSAPIFLILQMLRQRHQAYKPASVYARDESATALACFAISLLCPCAKLCEQVDPSPHKICFAGRPLHLCHPQS